MDSSKPDIPDAIETRTTLAYDAIRGGRMASDTLHGINQSHTRKSAIFSRYGSPVHRQFYIYNLLSSEDRVLRLNIGTVWRVGGRLMSW